MSALEIERKSVPNPIRVIRHHGARSGDRVIGLSIRPEDGRGFIYFKTGPAGCSVPLGDIPALLTALQELEAQCHRERL